MLQSIHTQKPVVRGVSDAESRTDLGNARRFIDLHGDDVRYCFKWRCWLVWDGQRWAVDETGRIEQLAKDIPDALWQEASQFNDSTARSFAAKSASEHALRSMLTLARSEHPVSPDDMDCDGLLLNCANGTLDLRNGQLRCFKRPDLLTCLCPTDYVPEARSNVWDSFLNSTFGGDSELIGYVQRLLGYSITANVSEQLLPVFWGAGANGKSTLINSFMNVLGSDYSMKAAPELLLSRNAKSHPTELADLHRKRFVAAVESPDGALLNETLVKELTGGDRIRARRMHRDFFEFDPTHKIVMCTNHKPRVRGTDHGIWRRLALVPFEQTFWNPGKGESGPEELRIDPELPDKLSEAREAILAWCVEGCLEWQRYGLQQPTVVRKATSEYQRAEDIVGQWLDERCSDRAGSEVRSRDAYSAFTAWCQEAGETPASKQKFGSYMKQRYEHRKSNGVIYCGVSLDPQSGTIGTFKPENDIVSYTPA